ncbi:MAG: dTMP kinase [Candidatus Dojkabacteria bacterium]
MFIVLDSIDGAGKGKQREVLTEFIKNNSKIELRTEGFPVHNKFYEYVVHPALQEEVTMNSASWVLSYLLDKTLQTPDIESFVRNKNNLYIADGYLTTTIAYQSLLMKQIKLAKLISLSKQFEIPQPDIAIFIDADPEVAFKRKLSEEGHNEGLDMFEKSLKKQKRLQAIFNKMVDKQIYCKWFRVDGNGSIEDVLKNIIKVLKDNDIISLQK